MGLASHTCWQLAAQGDGVGATEGAAVGTAVGAIVGAPGAGALATTMLDVSTTSAEAGIERPCFAAAVARAALNEGERNAPCTVDAAALLDSVTVSNSSMPPDSRRRARSRGCGLSEPPPNENRLAIELRRRRNRPGLDASAGAASAAAAEAGSSAAADTDSCTASALTSSTAANARRKAACLDKPNDATVSLARLNFTVIVTTKDDSHATAPADGVN